MESPDIAPNQSKIEKAAIFMQQLLCSILQAWSIVMRKNERNKVESIEGREIHPPQPTKSLPQEPWQPNKTAEFPWYLERVVHEESNWRGTWILEAKDIEAIDWETVLVPPNKSGPPGGGKCQQRRPTRSSSSPPKKEWQCNRTAEFPWCLEQIVQEGNNNWRATWILEVKDMRAMDWGTVRVPKEGGRGGKHQRKPTKHLPFTPERQQGDGWAILSDGGQDDLIVWLGKP
ncbi:hypothetical protein QBC40DRAFT_267431 [Triangularia verruculosa]|uniref:Uncharacterized protein n=1 Tax=Triangularia verruculosa TaxID=2587418 RepID=A0AAN6XBF4_9PEZI|nr:hypothetical protein QBC40DRAFT_267431 [Triangularia verruculosa]